MTDRAQRLFADLDDQIAELTVLIAGLDDQGLRRPCPGREKLGDGTIAAIAQHSADNYRNIAAFVATGHHRPDHARRRRPGDGHGEQYRAATVDRNALLDQLAASRKALERLSELTDQQLDAIPPKDSFRFCDGQRSLEQVLAGLGSHQRHQVDAVARAGAS